MEGDCDVGAASVGAATGDGDTSCDSGGCDCSCSGGKSAIEEGGVRADDGSDDVTGGGVVGNAIRGFEGGGGGARDGSRACEMGAEDGGCDGEDAGEDDGDGDREDGDGDCIGEDGNGGDEEGEGESEGEATEDVTGMGVLAGSVTLLSSCPAVVGVAAGAPSVTFRVVCF
jgi:hypothetical protein